MTEAETTHDTGKRPAGTLALGLAALGVVYGDIGTSPLYTVQQIFFGEAGLHPEPQNVLGALSLVLWTILVVVGLKYMLLVLSADNDGEGGVFALYGLLYRFERKGLRRVLNLLILAAGLLVGEGIVTPAISVLASVEGLKAATPAFEPFVVPLTVVILTVLFSVQNKGTAKVGRVFGPIVLVWFAVLAATGLWHVANEPAILAALSPLHGMAMLGRLSVHQRFATLGGVMLAVTGVEALFADMGHFGRRPIRRTWFFVVAPALLLNYLGQGAFLLSGRPLRGGNLFFSLVPEGALYPMILLATLATIFASQALISGAYSLAAQAIGLEILPRLKVVHTHEHHAGQIYVPFINWALYAGCVGLVLSFRSSNALAAAYGLSVSGVMLCTSVALFGITRISWQWSIGRCALAVGPFFALDLLFLASNTTKFLEGGFIPLTIGATIFAVMTTWRWGRELTSKAYSEIPTMTVEELVELKKGQPSAIDRTLVLMAPRQLRAVHDRTPALFQLFWDRYGSLPKNLIFVDVVHKKVPYLHRSRYHITSFLNDPQHGSVTGVTIHFGFMEEPRVEHLLEELASKHEIALPVNPYRWVVHVSLERLLAAPDASFPRRLRLKLFGLLRQVSQPAHYFYGLGENVHLTMEIMPVRIA